MTGSSNVRNAATRSHRDADLGLTPRSGGSGNNESSEERRGSMRIRKRNGKGFGRARFWLYFPDRLVGAGLAGTLRTPRHRPDCEIPQDNFGTVTVEASIDTHGNHHYVRAWAEGKRIDQSVLQRCADLVCKSWHSDTPEYPDGTPCYLRDGESIRLIVDFPVGRAGAAS